jgi:hypothetical protein
MIDLSAIPIGTIMLEPREIFDKGIIGFDDVLIYSMTKLVDAFMEDGATYSESLDWLCFNTMSMNIEGYPEIIDDLSDDYDGDSSQDNPNEVQ